MYKRTHKLVHTKTRTHTHKTRSNRYAESSQIIICTLCSFCGSFWFGYFHYTLLRSAQIKHFSHSHCTHHDESTLKKTAQQVFAYLLYEDKHCTTGQTSSATINHNGNCSVCVCVAHISYEAKCVVAVSAAATTIMHQRSNNYRVCGGLSGPSIYTDAPTEKPDS